LYKQYSRLEFSHDYDRPLAIAGLEQRLIYAFETEGGYGVFQVYFQRSLLWRRDQDAAMSKIDFPKQQKFHVPSWSWMAHKGNIAFVDPPFDGMQWEDEIRSPWDPRKASTSAWHTSEVGRRNDLRGVARNFHKPLGIGYVVYDERVPPRDRQVKCVVVGWEKLRSQIDESTQRHYVLLVAPKSNAENETGFQRVGVGILQGSSIDWDGSGLPVHIF